MSLCIAVVALFLQGCGGSPEPVPMFYAMEKGSCCCPEDHVVRSKAECEEALHSLAELQKFANPEAKVFGWDIAVSSIPTGCSFKVWPNQEAGHGHWNPAPAGRARGDMIPICMTQAHGLHGDAEQVQLFDSRVRIVDTCTWGSTVVVFLALASVLVAATLVARRRSSALPFLDAEQGDQSMSLTSVDVESVVEVQELQSITRV